MKHRKDRTLIWLTPLIIAAPLITWFAIGPANGVSPEPSTGVGKTVTCQVDDKSGCTIQHGFGVKPDAVTVTVGGRGQLVSVPADQITATSYRVNFNWRTGSTWPAGTSFTFQVHFDLPAATSTPTPTVTTPPVTTPVPSPTPTGTASPVKTCTSSDPNFWTDTSTDNMGAGRDYPPYYVHNNMWNNSFGTYTMNVCGADNWYELVTQPLPGDFGVQAYPNVHKDYNNVALFNADGTPKIRSAKFAAKTPATCNGCIYNVAFDAWIGDGLNNELMIWTDNKAQTPAGSKVATVTIGGFTYDVWHQTGYTAYVSQVTQKYGTMPLGEFFTDMKNRGWVPKATTWQVDYGIEMVSTAGVLQRFDFTDFSIDDDY